MLFYCHFTRPYQTAQSPLETCLLIYLDPSLLQEVACQLLQLQVLMLADDSVFDGLWNYGPYVHKASPSHSPSNLEPSKGVAFKVLNMAF